MSYPLYIFFGLAPSIIWLLFYLRKDAHPESNRMILKIFSYGILAALPAALIEMGIFEGFNNLTPPLSKWIGPNFSLIFIGILNFFIGVALIEEILKYLVVKEKVLNDPEFDEPTDAMLYMIISALGFAALENVLILLPLGPAFLLGEAITLSVLRFVGATFLHALSSGLVGYFLARAFFEERGGQRFIILGLGIAIGLHGLYNFSIMMIEGPLKFIIPTIILITLAVSVSLGFKKLRKMASVCKITPSNY